MLCNKSCLVPCFPASRLYLLYSRSLCAVYTVFLIFVYIYLFLSLTHSCSHSLTLSLSVFFSFVIFPFSFISRTFFFLFHAQYFLLLPLSLSFICLLIFLHTELFLPSPFLKYRTFSGSQFQNAYQYPSTSS